MRPPPSRDVGTSLRSVASRTGLPVSSSADLICWTLQSGWRWRNSAAPPATCGAAMLVPLNCDQVPRRGGTDERIETPGALTSGFIASVTGVGPPEENGAMTSFFATAAGVMAPAAVPGDEIEPKPKSWNSLPAAIDGTTPAFAAPFSAATTTSLA